MSVKEAAHLKMLKFIYFITVLFNCHSAQASVIDTLFRDADGLQQIKLRKDLDIQVRFKLANRKNLDGEYLLSAPLPSAETYLALKISLEGLLQQVSARIINKLGEKGQSKEEMLNQTFYGFTEEYIDRLAHALFLCNRFELAVISNGLGGISAEVETQDPKGSWTYRHQYITKSMVDLTQGFLNIFIIFHPESFPQNVPFIQGWSVRRINLDLLESSSLDLRSTSPPGGATLNE